MLTYHQCGHNFVWNLKSHREDGIGAGFIISPVNIEAEKIKERFRVAERRSSWMDPQFYLPHDGKGKLGTYSYFPANVLEEFSTSEFAEQARAIARDCLEFQASLDPRYLVIPTRHFEDIPDNHLDQLTELLVTPFLEARAELGLSHPILLTVIAKGIHLDDGPARDEILSWATGIEEVGGVYLLFDNQFRAKQLKDPGYLAGQLRFVHALRSNQMEVHIGYTGLEGLLLSIADPTSVTMGAYENLRRFDVARLETREPSQRRGPAPRIYSGRLLQSLPETTLPAVRELVPHWERLFTDSPYLEHLLAQAGSLSSNTPELYRHYFFVFGRQVDALPSVDERPEHVRRLIVTAREEFRAVEEEAGVVLDPDSDGSHLPGWLNAITMYEANPG